MKNNIKIDALEKTIQTLRNQLHTISKTDLYSSVETIELQDRIKELEAELDKEYEK